MIKKINTALGYTLPLNSLDEIHGIILESNKKGFDKYKVEKDFYLTIILHFVSKHLPEIAFKGGTCLNKVFYPYFRMSEDLDFSLSIEDEIVNTNGKREKFAKHMREKMKEFAKMMNRELNDDKYHHKKAQGNMRLKKMEYTYLKYMFTYSSIFDQTEQTIKIELTYTSKRHLPLIEKEIQSIFIDPSLENPIFPPKSIKCFSLDEMMAEKVRAGLTRIRPAIRDFFDVRYAQNQGYNFLKIKKLIHQKVEEVGSVYTLEDHYDDLQKQIDIDLLPVLGDSIGEFNFDQVYKFILSFKQ